MIAAILALSFAALLLALILAPVGREDSDGFHFGP